MQAVLGKRKRTENFGTYEDFKYDLYTKEQLFSLIASLYANGTDDASLKIVKSILKTQKFPFPFRFFNQCYCQKTFVLHKNHSVDNVVFQNDIVSPITKSLFWICKNYFNTKDLKFILYRCIVNEKPNHFTFFMFQMPGSLRTIDLAYILVNYPTISFPMIQLVLENLHGNLDEIIGNNFFTNVNYPNIIENTFNLLDYAVLLNRADLMNYLISKGLQVKNNYYLFVQKPSTITEEDLEDLYK